VSPPGPGAGERGLHTGVQLGPYEVLGPLGSGGMGEVYRARDSRLGREVALKVLPAGSSDPDRLKRFEQESRAASALNHPNLVAVFDTGVHEGGPYIVFERLQGETLRVRLGPGPLPARKAVECAVQIADGLAAAHQAGIVHRDLKPENVFVTDDGRIKILDFGLAKLRPSRRESGLINDGATASEITDAGTVLGTVGYMSPEQVEGKPTDHRSDIFSLGSVFYEMLSGRRAFRGDSNVETMRAILKEDPPALGAVGENVPLGLDRIVRRCLEKRPEERFQSARDIAFALEALSAASSPERPVFATGRPLLAWAAAALAGLALVVVGVGWKAWTGTRDSPTTPHPTMRLNINLPAAAGFTSWVDFSPLGALALSPDGRHIVYLSESGGRRQLFLRELDRLEPTPIAGTEGAYNPFFSPDGEWLGFAADGKLKKVPLRGGVPTILCDAPNVRGASWGPGGTILFGVLTGGLLRITAGGGTPQVVTTLDASRGEVRHAWPQILPNGKAALFSIRTARNFRIDEARIAVVSLETGKWTDVLRGGLYPRYVSSGQLLYWRPSSLFAVPFALDRLATEGEPVPVLEGVAGHDGVGVAWAEVGSGGSLVYLAGEKDPVVNGTLVWVDRHGKAEPVTHEQKPYGELALSPDGRRLAVTIDEPPDTRDLWVLDLRSETWTRLTSGEATNRPIWSPQGDQIVFASDRNGYFSPFRVRADGTGGMEAVIQCKVSPCWPNSLSPDGKTLAYETLTPETKWDVWALPLDGERSARLLVSTRASEWGSRVSPDGRWIAYLSDETDHYDIFVRSFPKGDQRWQIARDADDVWPVWSASSREIFYLSGEQVSGGDRMMAVSVGNAPSFTAGAPKALFAWRFGESFAVSPDAQRFLTIERPAKPPAPPQLVVIPDFLDELNARLRPGR
jgi:eukaryotic-like serine/threonine-protein kinase